jgi:hypothetical protein
MGARRGLDQVAYECDLPVYVLSRGRPGKQRSQDENGSYNQLGECCLHSLSPIS